MADEELHIAVVDQSLTDDHSLCRLVTHPHDETK
jgi:hypothetical protein